MEYTLFFKFHTYCLCHNEQSNALGGLTPYRLTERRVVRKFIANTAVHALSAINERGGGGGGGPPSSPRLPSLPWSCLASFLASSFPSRELSFTLLSTISIYLRWRQHTAAPLGRNTSCSMFLPVTWYDFSAGDNDVALIGKIAFLQKNK